MSADAVKTLAEFDEDLARLNIRGQWQFDAAVADLTDGPKPLGVPYLWRWTEIREKLLEACEVMPESLTARRNFSFMNPGLSKPGTTHTIIIGMQMVMPGEIAWAHRHTIGALRFAIEGDERLYTVVNGEKFPMEPNDLILTPNWCWHDHHNESDRQGVWLDVLDVPLVFTLNQVFYEPFGESTQPVLEKRGEYLSERARLVRPRWAPRAAGAIPFRYPWREVREQLYGYGASEGSSADGIILEYVHPMNGGSTLPTLGCSIQRLPAGFAGEEHRHTSSAVYHVVQGSGTTIVGDTTISWSERDVFAIPNWMRHRHINAASEDAILFSVTDEPVLSALGLSREDPQRGSSRNATPIRLQ
jgi:gentisate 1,2-dioxygenase/1-hydroxy-2-naphthoate dioxygenase